MNNPRQNILSFFAAVAIPLTDPTGWQSLSYDKIQPNKIEFKTTGLSIQVKSSASPLIYPLPNPRKIRGFKARLLIRGEMNASAGAWEEDSYLRFGFVTAGSRRLNFFEKLTAAKWVKKLFELAPSGSGIDKIYFYCIGTGKMILGARRVHPQSKLMEESIIANKHAGPEPLLVSYSFPEAREVAALWLATDGDDTQSEFTVEIQSLELIE